MNTVLRLSAMMFLQYLFWGAWSVTLGTYLGRLPILRHGNRTGRRRGVAIGAVVSPFFVGMIADRFFAE